MHSNLNSNCSNSLYLRNLQDQVEKSISFPKIVLISHCSNILFLWSQKICKVSDFSLKFQMFFSVTRTIFLTVGRRSEQFWKQNTILTTVLIFGHNSGWFSIPFVEISQPKLQYWRHSKKRIHFFHVLMPKFSPLQPKAKPQSSGVLSIIHFQVSSQLHLFLNNVSWPRLVKLG